MLETIVTFCFYMLVLYLVFGILFSVFFHFGAIKKMDSSTDGAGWFFRILITPGVIALWPILFIKWQKFKKQKEYFGDNEIPVSQTTIRSIHATIMPVLAVLLPILVGVAIANRQPHQPVSSFKPEIIQKLQPAAFDKTLYTYENPFRELPIKVKILSDGKSRQIEMDITGELKKPAIGLYWKKNGDTKIPVFLGNIWGPEVRRFVLTNEMINKQGEWILYSAAHGEILATATFELK